jgi:hypothetical protein
MRQAFILGRKHGETEWKMVVPPEAPFHEVNEAWRRMKTEAYADGKTHPTSPLYAEIQFHSAAPDWTLKMEAAETTKKVEKGNMKKVVSLIVAAGLLALAAFTAQAQARYDSSYVVASGDATYIRIPGGGGAGTNVNYVIDARLQDKITLQIDVLCNTNGAYTFSFPFQRSGDGVSYAAITDYITFAVSGNSNTVLTNLSTYGVGWLKIPWLTNNSVSGTITNIVIRPILKRNAP